MPKRIVELGPDFKINVKELIESKLLISANSGGGKTWAIRKLLEATHGLVQQIVIDPEGEMFTLREQFDYVLAAPKSKECVADLRSASKLPIRLLELGVSCIVDIYELGTSKKLFVKRFCEALVNAPRELWRPCLIVIDEAHLFAPEQGQGNAESKDAVAQLASLGRKRGFCTVLATQRIAKLDKDVAAECNNRLIGRCSIDVDRKRAAQELGITNKDQILNLRKIKPGCFFAFGPAISDDVKLVTIGDVSTKHLKAGQRSAKKPAPSAKVKAVLSQFADLPHEAEEEAKTLADWQKRYRELEAQAKLLQVKADRNEKRVEIQTKTVERLVFRDNDIKRLDKLANKLRMTQDGLAQLNADFLVAAVLIHTTLDKAKAIVIEKSPKELVQPQPKPSLAPTVQQTRGYGSYGSRDTKRKLTVTEPQPGKMTVTEGPLPSGEALILRAAIQYGTVAKTALGTLTGYKRQTRDAYIARLVARGYLENGRGEISPTDVGRKALPNAEPLPTGAKLRDWWRAELPEGERKILDVLIAAYPKKVSKPDIDAATGYKRQTRDAYISRMRSRQIIDDEHGSVGARSTLFE